MLVLTGIFMLEPPPVTLVVLVEGHRVRGGSVGRCGCGPLIVERGRLLSVKKFAADQPKKSLFDDIFAVCPTFKTKQR